MTILSFQIECVLFHSSPPLLANQQTNHPSILRIAAASDQPSSLKCDNCENWTIKLQKRFINFIYPPFLCQTFGLADSSRGSLRYYIRFCGREIGAAGAGRPPDFRLVSTRLETSSSNKKNSGWVGINRRSSRS